MTASYLGHRLVNSSVEIDTNTEVATASFSDGSHTLEDTLDFSKCINVLTFVGGIHLDSLEAITLSSLGLSTNVVGTISTNPLIHLDLIADSSTHQLMNRDIVVLALNIPERLIYLKTIIKN
jgi:hypothetical protein